MDRKIFPTQELQKVYYFLCNRRLANTIHVGLKLKYGFLRHPQTFSLISHNINWTTTNHNLKEYFIYAKRTLFKTITNIWRIHHYTFCNSYNVDFNYTHQSFEILFVYLKLILSTLLSSNLFLGDIPKTSWALNFHFRMPNHGLNKSINSLKFRELKFKKEKLE